MLGILSYIKIGVIAALVIFCAWIYFDRQADKALIAKQAITIANQGIQIHIISEKQKTLEAVQKKTQTIRVQVQKSEDKVDPVTSGKDGAAVIQLFDGFRIAPVPKKAVK